MGVKTLWSVIGGAGEPTDLRSLQGKCIAIDLAGWAVQGGQCAGMHRSGVTKVIRVFCDYGHLSSLIYTMVKNLVHFFLSLCCVLISATPAKSLLSYCSTVVP